MGKKTLLSLGLALFGAAVLPFAVPASAAQPGMTPAPSSATAARPDVVFNSVFIFFRNEEATLTPLMLKQVTRAAQLAQQGNASRIKITGYSDSAGNAETLGQQRADAVKAELVKLGIAADLIETQARAKEPPPSDIGGTNPANHRVRISLVRPFAASPVPRDGGR